jgi:hypothetical protein
VTELVGDDVLVVVGGAGDAEHALGGELGEAVALGVDDDVGVDDLARDAVAREEREGEDGAVEALRKIAAVEGDPAGVDARAAVVPDGPDGRHAHVEAGDVADAAPGPRGRPHHRDRVGHRLPVEHRRVDDEVHRRAMPTHGVAPWEALVGVCPRRVRREPRAEEHLQEQRSPHTDPLDRRRTTGP